MVKILIHDKKVKIINILKLKDKFKDKKKKKKGYKIGITKSYINIV